jgi:tetratricopeptide (TPR) repeat protein
MSRLGFLFVTALVLAPLPKARAADGPPPDAKRHADACVKAYDLAEYERAIKECKAAYEIFPAPLLLYSLGQAYRKLGDNPRALELYRKYLAKAPNGSQRRAAEDQVVQLAATIEAAERMKKAPPEGALPASHGEAARHSGDAIRASSQRRRWYRQPLAVGGWTTLGLGVGVLGIGGGILAQGTALRSGAAAAQTLEEQRQKASDSRTFEATGYALLGLGSAFVLTGAVLTGFAASRHRSISAFVAPSSDGISVVFGGVL